MSRILFIHPDKKICDLYCRHLRQRRFLVDSAFDGLTALRKLKANSPHLVVSEFFLPLISGISLLKFIRSHPKFHSVPFLFFTDHVSNSDALSFAANDWIERKEIIPDQLIERIYHHLKINKDLIRQSYGL